MGLRNTRSNSFCSVINLDRVAHQLKCYSLARLQESLVDSNFSYLIFRMLQISRDIIAIERGGNA